METEATLLSSPVSSLAGRREWTGLAVLALPTLLVSMDATVTYLAIPSLSASLKPTGAQLLWITDIYTFMEGGFLIIMGALGDRIGRKRLLTIGFVLFAIASVMAAFAGSANLLIAARAILGITGAIILPCTLSLIRNMFQDERQRTIAFGIYTACYSGGTMLGPLIGGVLLTHFWWGSVFLISVPLMFLFLLASGLLPEYRDTEAKQFSLLSAVLLLAGMLSVTYGIKYIAESGIEKFAAWISIAAGILLISIFLYAQKIIRNPLINLRLFSIPTFSATLATLFLGLFCWSGLYLFVAQYLQLVLGLTPMISGLLTLLPAAITMAGCMLAPQTLRWIPRTATIILGNIIMLAGMLIFTQLEADTSLIVLIIASTCLSLGCGFIVTLGIDMVVSVAPHEQAGAVSGISESSTTFGSALGVALLGSIGTAVYRSEMLPASEVVTEEARNTLGGAWAASQQMPNQSSTTLLVHARSAFLESFHTAALLASAAIILMIVFFIVTTLNRSSNGK
ncbi:MAG TPA: MFS transporter [Ohtaekwangia sp.]|uniref:MFS transporter n=1 Tax=Ohtaekwangia sp. TaxID=2066019 RepID=UPI002F92D3C1